MIDFVFIQMSGVPGSGKTTLAHTIAPHIGAVVIDHDITKSALLDANVPAALAGRASYQVLDALARHLLHQGHSVIFDSPCFYTELLERGQRLAQEAQAPYRYIECVVEDLAELDRRLRTRSRLPSQLTSVYGPPSEGSGKAESGEGVFRDWLTHTKRPTANYLVLDTTRPLDLYLETALEYIKTGVGNR